MDFPELDLFFSRTYYCKLLQETVINLQYKGKKSQPFYTAVNRKSWDVVA